jgi:hypothetical protein
MEKETQALKKHFITSERRFETGLCCGERSKDMALSNNITSLEDAVDRGC